MGTETEAEAAAQAEVEAEAGTEAEAKADEEDAEEQQQQEDEEDGDCSRSSSASTSGSSICSRACFRFNFHSLDAVGVGCVVFLAVSPFVVFCWRPASRACLCMCLGPVAGAQVDCAYAMVNSRTSVLFEDWFVAQSVSTMHRDC